MERFKNRWESGNRHPGHADNLLYRKLEDYLDSEPKPVSVGKKVITINAEKDSATVFKIALVELQQVIK